MKAGGAWILLPLGTLAWAGQKNHESLSHEELLKLALPKKGIEIDLPPLAETGNSITMGIHIQTAEANKIQSFDIVAPENPNPLIMRIRLPQAQATLRFTTRIRLALSQDVWVVAQLDNGVKLANYSNCIVTLSACFDAT